jgi:4-amino-4-deoxy-L-arabinose transferase-like glycosyltransferase
MSSTISETGKERLRDLAILVVLIGALFGLMLGGRPLSVPDEGRYVEISREMAVTGDYVTPRLNGVKYFEKPALFYWLESFSIRLFGLNEFTLRLWPAIFALLGCLTVYGAGRRLYGRATGLIAAAVLATSVLYYALSRLIILDMPLTFFLSAALFSFLIGTHEPRGLKRRLYMWAFYAFSAFAVLTKGLIGIVIPGMVIGTWMALFWEWRLLGSIYLPSGVVLFLLIAAPWHVLVSRANPEFFNFYFIHEHFQRYLTTVHNRYHPAWYFLPVVLLGFFPWTAFLAQAVTFSSPSRWSDRHEHRDALFLLLWAVLVFAFFSASDSKLMPYILPVFPPLAVITGRYLSEAWKSGHAPGLAPGYVLFVTFGVVLSIGLAVAPHFRAELGDRGLRPYFYSLSALLFAGVLSAAALARWKNFKWAFSAIMATVVLFFVIASAKGGMLDTRSVKQLAAELKPRLKPGDVVVNYETYYQDLPVYLERVITVVGWKGELEFGTTVEDTGGWMIERDAFWKRWNGPATIYMFTKRKIYDSLKNEGKQRMYLIARTDDTVLVRNKELEP